jgi:hypothetical protein
MWQDDLCAAAACPPAPDRNTKDRHDMSHTHVKTMPRLASPRMLMWLPALVLAAWGLLSAAGMPLAPNSHAASTGGSTVNATVAIDVHIAGTCAAGTNFASVPLALGNNTLASCDVTFGTNNGATSTLKVESARTTGSDNMFCQAASVSAACGATFSAPGANAASLSDGQFGVQTTTISSCTTPTWTLNNFNPVPDSTTAGAGTTICSMTGTTDGDYDLEFVARRGAATPAGTYIGQAVFTAEAS